MKKSMTATLADVTAVTTIDMAASCGKLPKIHNSVMTRPITGLRAPPSRVEAVTSPAVWMKTMIQPAIRPGTASGSITRVKVRPGPAPAMREASVRSVSTLAAADAVLIPIQCEYYALEGLSQLLNTIKLVQQIMDGRMYPLTLEGLDQGMRELMR